jgi:protein-S-isoprenylcysteine O-methyltransferase Ste14
MMNINKSVLRGSVSIFYVLIGLEIVIMISPFAAYFYSIYGPLLNFLYDFKATAWLTGFFLPHAVVSKNVLLNFPGGFGRFIFSLGIIAFLIGAVQIYSAKLRRKGMVSRVLYRWVRHPQYLFLAIAGFGLLLFWPRFLILVMYISMLFVYYLLACYEEQRMLAKHGDSYRTYMQNTAMFLPGEPGGKIFNALFGSVNSRGLAIAISYGVVMIVVVGAAFGLRSYTISQTSIVYSPDKKVTAISTSPRSDQFLLNALNVAYQDKAVIDTLKDFQRNGHQGFLVHVMPKHYMMQGLFVQPAGSERRSIGRFLGRVVLRFLFPFLSSHGHHRMMGGMKNGTLRLIFSQLTWPNGQYAKEDQALNFNVKHLPLLKVDIDLNKKEVLTMERTSRRNFWGQMPMPLF